MHWAGDCAFSAYHASNIQIHSSGTTANAILPFTERYDIGSHFNPTTGVFTAPVTGIYRFNVFLHAMGINASTDFLYVNMNDSTVYMNQEIMIVSGTSNENYNTSVNASFSGYLPANSTVGPLLVGSNTAQGSAYWRGGATFNTFSGELVRPV